MTTHTWSDMRRLAVDAAQGKVNADQILDWVAAYTDGRVAAEHAKVEQQIDEHAATRVQAERERIAGDIRRWLLDESLTYGEVGGPANAHDAGYWYGTREMAGRVLRMLGAGD